MLPEVEINKTKMNDFVKKEDVLTKNNLYGREFQKLSTQSTCKKLVALSLIILGIFALVFGIGLGISLAAVSPIVPAFGFKGSIIASITAAIVGINCVIRGIFLRKNNIVVNDAPLKKTEVTVKQNNTQQSRKVKLEEENPEQEKPKSSTIIITPEKTNSYPLPRPRKRSQCKSISISNSIELVRQYGNLVNFPMDILTVETVTKLDLCYNLLKEIPKEISKLKNLKYLYLSHNNIKRVPAILGELVQLEELYLGPNQIAELPEKMFSANSSLTTISFKQNHLTKLPNSICQLKLLQKLYLDSFQITNYTGNTSPVHRIQHNTIQTLPEKFGELQELVELNVRMNKLRGLPKSFGNLKKLETLDLSDNQLSSLPPNFGNLSALTYLKLSNNNINSLPSSMQNLSKLKVLELYNNPLNVPEWLFELPELEWVWISFNQYLNLPKKILKSERIRLVDLAVNPEDLRKDNPNKKQITLIVDESYE